MKRTLTFLSVLLVMVLTMSLLTVPAFAAEAEINVGGVDLASGDYLAVGAKEATTTKPSGGYAYYKDGMLELNNYDGSYSFGGDEVYYYNINATKDLKIVLTGNNSAGRLKVAGDLQISGNGSLALYPSYSDNGIYADGSITVTGGDIQITTEKTGVFAEAGDITITGGKLTVETTRTGISAYAGSVTVTNGTVNIIADGGENNYGTNSGYDGIYAKENILINGGKLDIYASYRGLNAKGDVTVQAGTVQLDTGNYAVYAGNTLTVGGGKITAESWYSNLCAGNITINGGELDLTGDSTAIYAETGNIVISEGTISIDAYDGIYAEEGSIAISGGNTTIISQANGITTSHAQNGSVSINGGKLAITAAEQGISPIGGLTVMNGEIRIDAQLNGVLAEYGKVVINGGKLDITAKEDGIATFDYADISISGGELSIIAGQNGFGISASDLTITGGAITVESTNTTSDSSYSAIGYETYGTDTKFTLGSAMGIMTANKSGETLRSLSKTAVADMVKQHSYDYLVIGKACIVTTISEAVSIYEAEETCVVGTEYTLPVFPAVQDGVNKDDVSYDFLGWSVNGTDKKGGEVITLTGDTILYAKWRGHEDAVPPVPENPGPSDPTTPSDPSEPTTPTVPSNPFTDVAEGKFFYEPVLWAVGKGITTGKTDTTFDPSGLCTRAQVVTFLWRAAGKPAPKSSNNPFPDVPAGKYYTDAVLWAVENNITAGFKDGSFGPGKTCTRAQIVTFLWRYAGEPAPQSMNNPFPDVDVSAYYGQAVLWAVENGITGGFKDGTFGPNKTCTRDQIVTFLYRYMVE